MPGEAEIELAEFIRPEDLLENAKYLLELGEPKAKRAVVLESMTALEVYVQNKVFRVLETKRDTKFVKWLKEKTEMNFEDRLGIITPFALEIKILKFKESDLWRRFQNARKLRNNVTHKGLEISLEEAEEVYKTVYDWLAYLESTIGLELSLYKFKQIIEESDFPSFTELYDLENRYFYTSMAGFNLSSLTQIKYPIEVAFDLGLKFGEITISFDTKTSSGTIHDFNFHVESVIGQTRLKLRNPNIDRATIIIYHKGKIPDSFNFVRHFEDGKIYIVAIKIELDHPFFKKN